MSEGDEMEMEDREEDMGLGLEGEDVDALSHLPPDHPLLKRIQDTISKQLLKHKERLSIEIRTKEDELKQVTRKRDEMGVELYGVQQQLAKLHQNLEKSLENYQQAAAEREQAEVKLSHLSQNHKLKAEELDLLKSKYELQRQELEKISAQVRQVEQHAKQVESQIAVAKRATQKAEVDIVGLEKTKLEQDLLIDNLQQQLTQLEQQKGTYDAQIISQRKETQTANQILAQAQSEMDAIGVEKKQLWQQWRNSLVALEKREETLRERQKECTNVREKLMLMDTEANGFKLATKIEQDKNEQLTQILNKSNNEVEYLNTKIAGINERRDKLTHEYSQLQRVLEHTEVELAKVMGERNGLEEEVNSQQRQGDLIVNETVKIENQIRDNLQIQKTIEKSSASTAVGVNKMVLTIEEKYMQVAQLQNELSKMRVDSLSIQAHVQTLEKDLAVILQELREKDRLVEKYEQEIRRRNDEIERKQSEVDRLNRKYDQLASNHQDENTGPLEATIHNLTNEISAKRRECADLQHYWLKAQTDMVGLSKDYQDLLGQIADLQGQLTILKQKRLRLNSNFETNTEEIRQMEGNIRTLRKDLQRFNVLIAKNSSLQDELKEQNRFLESEFMGKLREMETEAITLEQQIEESRIEKERLLQEILDTENVKMLWEKKIQLGKETQDALDPNVGASEQRAMKKEIGRMEFKLANLKREQEQLIQEMERAYARRESFVFRGLAKQSKTAVQAKANAQLQAKKNMQNLAKKIKQLRGEVLRADNTLEEMFDANEAATNEGKQYDSDLDSISAKNAELTKYVEDIGVEKQMKFDETTVIQNLVKRYSSADMEQKFEAREATLDREIARQLDKATKIEQLLESAREQLPDLADRIEQAVRGSRASPASSARNSNSNSNSNPNSTRNQHTPNQRSNSNHHLYKLTDDVNGMSLSPKGNSNAARSSKPATPNGARSSRSNA